MTNLSPARPAALMSAAAAALAGADPLTVSDIAADHPMLPAAVRELAALTGEPVPSRYALPEFDPNYDCGIDPREGFPHSAWEAEDHYQWARENGLA